MPRDHQLQETQNWMKLNSKEAAVASSLDLSPRMKNDRR